MEVPGWERGKAKVRSLSHSLLVHRADSRDMLGAMEASGVPAGQAVPPTFAPCSSLAAILALPVCEKEPGASSVALWPCSHSSSC